MDQPLTFKDPHQHAVSATLSTPDAPTDRIAVLCHGFLSSQHSTTNKTLTRLLAAHDIATLRFDFFGHGDSQGPFERLTVGLALSQALAALDLVAARGYAKVGLVGSSFGGLVAILAAARWAGSGGRHPDHGPGEPQGVACLALKCPVVDFPEELELELGESGMADWRGTNTVPNFAGGAGRIKLSFDFYEDAQRHIAYGAAPSIRAPTLIVQGDRDELIPLHQSRRFFDALTVEKSLHLIRGADHQFSRGEDFSRMTTLISEWLVAHLSGHGAAGSSAEARPR